MSIKTFSRSTAQIVALGLTLTSIPVILAVDVYLTPWRVPTRILYAIPIIVAARLFGALVATIVIVVAIAFSVLDILLVGPDLPTDALAILALAAVGLLSLLWARAERRAQALAAERARLYEQEQQRAAELRESHARLLEFFSMVAHDLRAPLTTISGFSQMLPRYEALPSEQRERLARSVQSSVRQIVRLSSDLLDASRIGAGRFEISKEPCDLMAVTREVVEQRRPAAPCHHLILEATGEGIESHCDPDRIAQVIGNLVDNAIKYSPQGGTVRVVVERVGGRARIAVSDQGIGIAPGDIPRLFQPYVRLRGTTGAKGLGLGLYIVKGIVEAHGGAIDVQSQPGQGSTFTIDLPLTGPA
ncbi:MAG: HAMP domain-containing histidine kinase [Chloroflexi bacterium]|nr:HAMP domain-containing histidine kinase [Chloroflexota bacterium]